MVEDVGSHSPAAVVGLTVLRGAGVGLGHPREGGLLRRGGGGDKVTRCIQTPLYLQPVGLLWELN